MPAMPGMGAADPQVNDVRRQFRVSREVEQARRAIGSHSPHVIPVHRPAGGGLDRKVTP